MQIVGSKEKNDCGVCAVACMTGRPWHEVRAAIMGGRMERGLAKQKEPNLKDNSTTGLDLIDGVKRLDWEVITPHVKSFPTDVPRGQEWDVMCRAVPSSIVAIVKVQYADAKRAHWVVFDGHHIFDSNWDCPVRPMSYPFRPLSFMLFMPKPENDL